MHNVFKRWLEGVKAYDDLDTLRQTMLLEQFFHVLPDELKLWLTDQKPKSLSEAAQLADQYVALHKSVSVKQAVSGVQPESATDSKVYTVFNKQSDRNGTKAFSKRRSFRNVTCFKCHRRGHIMSQCRVKLKPTFTVGQEQPDTTQTSSASNSVQSVTFPVPQVNTVHPLFEPFCECGYIVHNDTGDRTKITILRDTAALQSLLSKSCLPPDNFVHADEVCWIRGISGNIMEIPVVEVWLQSDLCDHLVRVGLVDTLPDGVDFLLGNDLWYKFKGDTCDLDLSDCLPVTRSMTRASNVLQPNMQSVADAKSDDRALQDVHKLFDSNEIVAGSSNISEDDSQPGSSSLADDITTSGNDNNVPDLQFGDMDLSSVVSRDEFISLQQSDKSLSALIVWNQNHFQQTGHICL